MLFLRARVHLLPLACLLVDVQCYLPVVLVLSRARSGLNGVAGRRSPIRSIAPQNSEQMLIVWLANPDRKEKTYPRRRARRGIDHHWRRIVDLRRRLVVSDVGVVPAPAATIPLPPMLPIAVLVSPTVVFVLLSITVMIVGSCRPQGNTADQEGDGDRQRGFAIFERTPWVSGIQPPMVSVRLPD